MPSVAKTNVPWVGWTSELSPFGLKVILLCRYHGLHFRVLPEQGTAAEASAIPCAASCSRAACCR